MTDMTIENLLAYPELARYIENDTSEACFVLGNKSIHRNDAGDYCYYELSDRWREHFHFGDPVVSKELTPLEDEFMEHMAKLEEADAISAPFGLSVVQIEYFDDAHVYFTTYSEELQIFYLFEGNDFVKISDLTHLQLAAQGERPNTFTTPTPVKLDVGGNVLQEVKQNA